MSSERLFARIPLLTRDNYHTWKIGISAYLREVDSLDIVTGTTEKPKDSEEAAKWESKNAKALNYITLCVSENHYPYIEKCTTGAEAWEKLKKKYETTGRANRVALKHQLYNCKHDPERPIQDFIDEVTTLHRRLAGIGVTLEEADIVDVFLFNLHESWAPVASSLCVTLEDSADIADVEAALRDEEKRQRAPMMLDSSPSAMLARGGRGRKALGSTRVQGANGSGVTCYRCQAKGHIAKNCTAPAPVPEVDATPGEASHLAYAARVNYDLDDF